MTDPVPADQYRVGDAERQQAVGALGEHFAAGRLDRAEYDTRVQAAYAARTRVDLRGLFADLPDPAPFRDLPVRSDPGRVDGRAARDRRPARRWASPAPVFVPLVIAAAVAGAVLHAPILPLVLLAWFLLGRRVRC